MHTYTSNGREITMIT